MSAINIRDLVLGLGLIGQHNGSEAQTWVSGKKKGHQLGGPSFSDLLLLHCRGPVRRCVARTSNNLGPLKWRPYFCEWIDINV